MDILPLILGIFRFPFFLLFAHYLVVLTIMTLSIQEAFKIFADPTVQPSNPGEIISSFIDVGHEDLALRLAQVLQVPLGIESHFLVIIEVFVQNGALLGAFNFLVPSL